MSTGRVMWLIWCLAWAGFWAVLGFATLGVSLILAALSVAAFWLPVGKDDQIRRVMLEHDEHERQLAQWRAEAAAKDLISKREDWL